ncbi:MAG: aminoglycoside 3'-phosphotransferase/choline kinase family protein [Deltaproteobacteria bacterium]
MEIDHEALASAIATKLGIEDTPVRYKTGSVPVFRFGERVLKLFRPNEERYIATELAVLRRLLGRITIPTPEALDSGTFDDWHYLLMRRVEGDPLDEIWADIDPRSRVALMRSLGESMAQFHAVPTDDLDDVASDWSAFLAEYRPNVREKHLDKGLAERWADQLDAFVDRWYVEDDRRALLHTEVMRQHVMAQRDANGWRLSGIVDFEPSMVAPPDYELASVGVFTTCGEPGLLAAYLEGYGTPWDESIPNRIMAQAILHRYGNLKWYLERLGDADAATTLEGLAADWFKP